MKYRFSMRRMSISTLLALFLSAGLSTPLMAEKDSMGDAQSPAEAVLSPEVEKEKTLLGAIARRQKELDEREAAIMVEEARLLVIKKDVEKRIAELDSVLEKIEAFVRKIDEVNDERVRRVAKIYSSMNPEEAASRIEKIDEKTAVMILSIISERQAAKILSFVDVDKSVKLSQALKIQKIKIDK